MCWSSKIIPKKLIAEGDIQVFKIVILNLQTGILTPYYHKGFGAYVPGVNYKSHLSLFVHPEHHYRYGTVYNIDEGFHSYNPEKLTTLTINGAIMVGYGSSDVYTNPYGEPLLRVKKVKFIIPKGSVYYENTAGKIVSDHIIPTDEMLED